MSTRKAFEQALRQARSQRALKVHRALYDPVNELPDKITEYRAVLREEDDEDKADRFYSEAMKQLETLRKVFNRY